MLRRLYRLLSQGPSACALCWLGWIMPLHAGLQFERTEIDVAAEPGTTQLWIEFPFTNPGPGPVEIGEVHASCGCTVPELDRLTYAPGESGAIRVRFDIGDRQGLQSKQLTVNAGDQSTVLRFNATIPARLEFRPRLVLFRGEDLSPRATTLTYFTDLPVTVLSVTSHSPAFTVEARPTAAGERYELQIALPERPAADVRGTLRVRARGASGREYQDVFFARYLPN